MRDPGQREWAASPPDALQKTPEVSLRSPPRRDYLDDLDDLDDLDYLDDLVEGVYNVFTMLDHFNMGWAEENMVNIFILFFFG